MKKISKKLWVLYDAVFRYIIIGFVLASIADKTTPALAYVDIIISLPVIVALHGWVELKQIGTKQLWRSYVAGFFLLDIAYNVFFNPTNRQSVSDTLIGLAILAPAYIATILYAVRFDKLRNTRPKSPIIDFDPSKAAK